jgi:CO/xanthine dehydrogenase Mo-binding subunit
MTPISAPLTSATSRVDGRAKVTGAAKYAGEFNVPGLAYGSVVDLDDRQRAASRASTPARRCASKA